LSGAGRAFRSFGFGGAGVDGLAKASGVTSGAFYAHFDSKADAFRATVVAGMRDLAGAIRSVREQAGPKWIERFVDFYVGEKRTCKLAESCALQSLTGDVERSSDETRSAYEAELRDVIDATAGGVDAPPRQRRKEAIALLALLAGGVSLARAVRDPALAAEIADAVRAAALGLRKRATRSRPA
jgi:TetR/AcrR family transcriptional regulator, transcriptional repressor for nem operon